MAHGLELSYDNGINWKVLKDTGEDTINCVEFGATIKPAKRTLYWLTSGEHVCCSMDGGATIYSDTDASAWLGTGLSTVVCAPSNPAVAYVGTWNETVGDPHGLHVYKTTDHGTNWTDKGVMDADAAVGRRIYSLAVDPTNPDRVIGMGYHGRAYYSTNGATSWTKIAHTEYAFDAGAAVCAFPTGEMYAAWHASSPYPVVDQLRIVNTAATNVYDFTVPSGGNPNFWGMAVALAGGTRGLAIGEQPQRESSLLLTKDRGASWTSIHHADLTNNSTLNRVAISKSGKILYVSLAGWKGLYKSTDDGSSWTKINTYVDASWDKLNPVMADPFEENWVWLLKYMADNVWTLFLSKNAGLTWNAKRSVAMGLATATGLDFAVGYETSPNNIDST